MIATLITCAVLSQFVVEAPAYSKPWAQAPARLEVADGVYTARVVDVITGQEVPCKVQQQLDKRYLYWTRTDDGSAAHDYRVELETPSSLAEPVFVGAEDMLCYGRGEIERDLGTGLWGTALPIDWEEDGDIDLLYSCRDVPQRGVYVYFQDAPGVFRRGQRLGDGMTHIGLADMNGDGKIDLIGGDFWFDDIRANGLQKRIEGPLKKPEYDVRYFIVRQADWDGDGNNDLISSECDWRDYGWDNAFDATGTWTRGPLHGPVFFHRNTGTNTEPVYAERVPIKADDKPIDGYGSPAQCIADFDADGDLDLITGEFRDSFTYYENVGTTTVPRLARGTQVMTQYGPLKADLCMLSPVTSDWNADGLPDLIIAQEDGRVSIALNQGMRLGAPYFTDEYFLKESTTLVRSGVLVNPWFDEATRDLYCGSSAGYIEWFQWRKTGYAEGRYVNTSGKPFRVMAGYNGSIQGPAEAKWGYTTCVYTDLNGDKTMEILYNSILGRIEYLTTAGARGRVMPSAPIPVKWTGEPPYPKWNWWKPGATDLVVEWRTRPQVADWDQDGRMDIIAMDHEGYLALYRGADDGYQPGERVFKNETGDSLRLNEREAGKSGRAELHLVDWDNDGDFDLLRNTKLAGWFENVDGAFTWRGDFPGRKLAGHDTCPNGIDWNGDGFRDLLLGAEDGHIYCYHRAAIEEPGSVDAKKK